MGFSLKLLVHLAAIGCFIGSTLAYPIDDKEEISKFQFNRPIGQPSTLMVSAVPSGEPSHGAIDDKGVTDGIASQQKTKSVVVVAGDQESTSSFTAAADGHPSNQNTGEVSEPVPTLDGSGITNGGAVVEVKNHDITKAKRSAEDDEGVYTSYSFRKSSHNGKTTEQVYEKETNIQDSSKDSDSHLNSGSDSHVESDSDSDSDSESDSSDSRNSEKVKYKVRRSSNSQLSGTNGAGNTKDKVKVERKVESPAVTDHPDNEDLDSRDSNTYGRSSEDEGNTYYEGGSLNFYSNSDDTQRASFLNPSYDEGDETYSEGESGVEGADGATEYTDDAYRRAKRSNDVDSELLSIIKNLKEESTKVQENKYFNETPDNEGSSVTDEHPSGEAVLKFSAYSDDGYGVQLGNQENVKKTESEDTTNAPTEENKDDVELDETFPTTSSKDSLKQDSSQNYSSSAVTPQRFNYRRVKRNDVYVLIAKKKGEKSEETAEVSTEEVNLPNDKLDSETSKVGESQSNEKLEHEETSQVTSDLEFSNLYNNGNKQEIKPSPTLSQTSGSSTDDKTRVKQSGDVKSKLVEIKKKIENEKLNKPTNEEDVKSPSEIQQDVILSVFDEPLAIGQPISISDSNSFSSSNVEDPSSVTYSNEYDRVSRHEDDPSSFGVEDEDSGSDVQTEQHPFENGPIVRNDDPQEEDAQPMSWINQ